jgi:hypothetical protein
MTLQTHFYLMIHPTVNCEILQGTAAFISLKDSVVLHSVWTQLTFCKCAIDQYYCYCQLTTFTENILCTLQCEMMFVVKEQERYQCKLAVCGKGTRKVSQ